MAGGMPFPAGLAALIVFVLLLHQTCTAKDTSQVCVPSSCGNIHNISHPFRLQGDPPNCGDSRYSLSCENNQTLLYLFSGIYYVKAIDYNNLTIRVVDPGINLEDDYSFIPRYFLSLTNFSLKVPYVPSVPHYLGYDEVRLLSANVVFLKCEKPVNSTDYLDVSTCSDNGSYSSNSSLSHSKRYRYVLFLDAIKAEYVENLCQVEQIMTLSSSPLSYQAVPRKISCTDFHNELVEYGFELSFAQNCGCNNGERCSLSDSGVVQCHSQNGILGALTTIINRLTPNLIRQRVDDQILPNSGYRVSLIRLLLITSIDTGLYLAAKSMFWTPFVIAFLIYKWHRRHLSMYDTVEEFLQSQNNLMPIRYSYSEICKMTKSFKEELGEGGFGTVFKGTLRSGQLVAVKMLSKSNANGQDFINEVATIGRIHHVNVVKLIGFCVERSKRALVYEFMSNGSLNKYIFSQEGSILLSYEKIRDVALGVARGIEYLHRGCDMQILHFDIKPHNILLDEDFTPKVSDFGLAKLYPADDNIVSLTSARGTLGYMAPELYYKNIGGISYKADVYSFGMLLMEMASRRKNLNTFAEHSSQTYFPTWAYDQFCNGKDVELEGTTEEDKKIGKTMIIVALWCIQMNPNNRPSMNKVVEMLEGEVDCLQMPSKPFLSSSSASSLSLYKQVDMEDSSTQTWSSIRSSEPSAFDQA
ncbi:LEAF RUST 10 DISEASE-RESISTANCE LOCUS RECEPTOR-LIKE PROTEIN KINASE-like 2.2 isoform X1 [Carya illinoinensis]|uniref:Protein kinase domain-containing protein n=1 Tax=Carya illinoinensis TaxID=32201 RepID=A0A8T1QPG0_CARIL|nr:LEAF RUST 10 DISEASE-RESISTANCE LOCUS RECEPTOR-LIKE PROTEIN KINASE-like 2.2 isoform X1 [Carya illinoinensis]XP_042982289.1 LEAF RUST 10 DISEASE-RESISTANCE LOCUS RECEPTOR-LIKE PROTEIN KINASE-like 2.2 isoform X1 [Carya illinoinensis]XP_042982290.1 LEAF RUST 10 DISEASE-RESISTANCE LOCUS RECEPTOR-LIKE PROTEIN KINASE-like 2.2 isoform X1 [Carya illinoinensis]KAG6656002.1 hypothetical protein CIPAW_05G256400 [Carya illinoinensis]KAG6656004.1 hypothetical protein CIPAW_05G256400 [Carya illinoinensis]